MRTSLELYLLSLIHDGVSTPYELLSRASLSLGSSVPALARLERDGLIRGSAVQARRSRRFTVTRRGWKILEAEWREHLSTEPNNLDSILRISYLAWKHGSPKDSATYLNSSGLRLIELSKLDQTQADLFGTKIPIAEDEVLRWLSARVASRRMAAEGDELVQLGRQILTSLHKSNAARRRRKS